MDDVRTGDEALARAVLDAGARVVAGYPGSPSSGVMHMLARVAMDHGVHVEWSTNERVGFEVALGASIAGARSVAAMKGVGMNVALDPIMVANLTGVEGGLVILLGDDPGAWSSQSDQDTRTLGMFAELPMWEPGYPQEGYDMMRAAFELSERASLPVIVRETRSYAGHRGPLATAETYRAETESPAYIPRDREARRWIPSTDNAVRLHRELHDKLGPLSEDFAASMFNSVSGDGDTAIAAAGFVHTKVFRILEEHGTGADFKVLKLGTLHPLPTRLIADVLCSVRRVLVFEENEPYIERQLKAIAHDCSASVEIRGKESGDVAREGELFDWQIAEALLGYEPGCLSDVDFDPDGEMQAMRARGKASKPAGYLAAHEGLCEGCPYEPTFESLAEVLEELDEDPIFIADPGCGVRLRTEPFKMLDIKFSLSSAIGVACGIAQASPETRVIAFPGDSAFFHSAITDLLNAAYNRVRILVLVLDNRTTALSGFEPHPGIGVDAMGRKQRRVMIEDLASACQIDFVRTVDPRSREATKATFRDALAHDDLAVVVARDPCPFAENHDAAN